MSTSSTASGIEGGGMRAMVSLNGYRLQTTTLIGAIFCSSRSDASDGMLRARMPGCFLSLVSLSSCVSRRRRDY